MDLSFLKKRTENNRKENFDPIAETKNWYSDKYESIIIQRNILIIIIIFSIIAIIVGNITTRSIISSKTIEPFIVEIDDKSGITTVVNPLTRKDLMSDKALNSYFIIKFLKARETYSSFEADLNTNIIKLMSANNVFIDYAREIGNTATKYGASNTTSLRIRSLIIDDNKVVQVRFSIIENAGAKNVYNKIANISYTYNQNEMNEEARQINPLGFQIVNYRVSDENL